MHYTILHESLMMAARQRQSAHIKVQLQFIIYFICHRPQSRPLNAFMAEETTTDDGSFCTLKHGLIECRTPACDYFYHFLEILLLVLVVCYSMKAGIIVVVEL